MLPLWPLPSGPDQVDGQSLRRTDGGDHVDFLGGQQPPFVPPTYPHLCTTYPLSLTAFAQINSDLLARRREGELKVPNEGWPVFGYTHKSN